MVNVEKRLELYEIAKESCKIDYAGMGLSLCIIYEIKQFLQTINLEEDFYKNFLDESDSEIFKSFIDRL